LRFGAFRPQKERAARKRPEVSVFAGGGAFIASLNLKPELVVQRMLKMATEQHTRGGSHEQHVKAGEQSHKNTSSGSSSDSSGEHSGTHE
jgi:hypothetical protein